MYPLDFFQALEIFLNNNLSYQKIQKNKQIIKNEYEIDLIDLQPNVNTDIETAGIFSGYRKKYYSDGRIEINDFTITGEFEHNCSVKYKIPTYATLSGSIGSSFNIKQPSSSILIKNNKWWTEDKYLLYSLGPYFEISLLQPLFIDNKFINLQVYKAKKDKPYIEYKIAEISEHINENAIIINFIKLYFDYYIFKKQKKYLAKKLQITQQEYEIQKKYYSLGKINQNDLEEADISLQNVNIDFFDMKNSYQKTQNKLKAILIKDEETELEIENKMIIDPSIISKVKGFLQINKIYTDFDLKKLQMNNDLIYFNYLLNIVKNTPVIDITLKYDANPITDSSFRAVLENWLSRAGQHKFTCNLKVSIPVYNGGKAHKEKEKLINMQRKNQYIIKELLIEKKNQFKEIKTSIIYFEQKNEILKKSWQLKKTKLTEYKNLYDQKKLLELDIEKIKNSMQKAYIDYIKNLKSYYLKLLDGSVLLGFSIKDLLYAIKMDHLTAENE